MLDILYTTKEKAPVKRAFFVEALETVIGEDYDLSLVFIGDKRSKSLNNKFRKKNYATDILSFNLEKNSGEIFINLKIAKKKSSSFSMNYPNYLKYVFIHGLCHLKGMAHGSRMEYQERRFLKILCHDLYQLE